MCVQRSNLAAVVAHNSTYETRTSGDTSVDSEEGVSKWDDVVVGSYDRTGRLQLVRLVRSERFVRNATS